MIVLRVSWCDGMVKRSKLCILMYANLKGSTCCDPEPDESRLYRSSDHSDTALGRLREQVLEKVRIIGFARLRTRGHSPSRSPDLATVPARDVVSGSSETASAQERKRRSHLTTQQGVDVNRLGDRGL